MIGIQKLVSKCPYTVSTRSTKKKLSLALAFIGDPKVVLLDEPFQDLDPASAHQVWSILEHVKKLGRTIMIFSEQ